nr:MAG: Pectate lyase superfamily protein [Bacteriophage sp.]
MTKIQDLRQLAHTIKTEKKVGGNTADRVGSAFEGVADALEGTEQIAEMDKAVQEVQQQVEASKAHIQSLVNALPVVQQTGDSTTSVMSQKAVTDALKTSADSGFSKTPYISKSTIGVVYEIMINVKSGDKYHYQGSVDNGKWGITMYEDATLATVKKTLVAGHGSEKIDVEGVFEQDGWCVVYNRNFVSNFGLFEVFKPTHNITSENNVEDLDNPVVKEYDIKGDNNWVIRQLSVSKGDILSIASSGDKSLPLLKITSTEDNSNVFTIPFVKQKNIVTIEAPFDGVAKVSNRNYDSTLSSLIVTEKEKFLTSQGTKKEREHFVFPQTSLVWDEKSFDVFARDTVKGFLYGDKTHLNAVTFTAKNGEEKVLFVFDGNYNNTPLQFSLNIAEDGVVTLQNRSLGGHLGEVHIESPIEQCIDALQSGFNELLDKVKSATSYDFNVKAYGAKGDGVADDTDAIQAAIDACCKAGGGTVFIPNGIYRLHKVQSRTDGTYTKTGHLFIPVTSNLENRITLKIRGESAVQYTTFYVDARMGTGVTGNKGATLYSDYLPEDTSKALDNPISVITSVGWTNGGIPQNVTIVKMESFNICTKCSDLGYPFVSGVDGSLMAQLDCRDMDIRTDGMVKNLKKSPNGHICFGMMVGASLDDPHQSLDYINISQGFNYGLISGLHLSARCIDIQTCVNAFTFSKGGHFSEFSLITIHHCANNIVCLDKEFDNVKIGATRVLFHLFNYETQVGATPTDFGFKKAVVDPNNNIFGKCDYFLGWSASGADGWTMDGGRHLKCTSL